MWVVPEPRNDPQVNRSGLRAASFSVRKEVVMPGKFDPAVKDLEAKVRRLEEENATLWSAATCELDPRRH